MSFDVNLEVGTEEGGLSHSFNDIGLQEDVSRRIITTLNPDTSELLHVPEIGEFDNDRVDKVIEQYDFETLLRFPGILIECFLNRNIGEKELKRFSCGMKGITSDIGYEQHIEYTWESLKSGELHLDGEDNIILYYENMPIANIGLDGNFICQIQSANIYNISNIRDFESQVYESDEICDSSHNYFIEGFNWKKVLVKLAEVYLKESKAPEVFIKPAGKNSWEKVMLNASINQWGYNIYDKTALELGYQSQGYGYFPEWYRKNIK